MPSLAPCPCSTPGPCQVEGVQYLYSCDLLAALSLGGSLMYLGKQCPTSVSSVAGNSSFPSWVAPVGVSFLSLLAGCSALKHLGGSVLRVQSVKSFVSLILLAETDCSFPTRALWSSRLQSLAISKEPEPKQRGSGSFSGWPSEPLLAPTLAQQPWEAPREVLECWIVARTTAEPLHSSWSHSETPHLFMAAEGTRRLNECCWLLQKRKEGFMLFSRLLNKNSKKPEMFSDLWEVNV